jgi:hypothetical protein
MTPLQRQNLAKQGRPFGAIRRPKCKQPLASGSKRPSDIANLPRAFGHSADTKILELLPDDVSI